jgi:ribonuclease VapC
VSDAVLDSSAFLALLQDEPGADKVRSVLPGALMSSVNAAEVVSKLCERGMPSDQALSTLEALGVLIVDFDAEQARLTGELRPKTREAGLSLGDLACLALAAMRQLPAMTADAAWSSLSGLNAVLIRN